jgi:hypothetical protein
MCNLIVYEMIFVTHIKSQGRICGGECGIRSPYGSCFFFEYNTLIYLKNVMYK